MRRNSRTHNPGVGLTVEGPGTGDGFKKFCAGETDISDASRAIKDSEIEACTEAGIDFIELYVAIDGLSVLTSPENDKVSCVTFNDLYALTGPESTGFTTWSAAAGLAQEIGGVSATNYFDEDLVITGPGEESGTYDTFVEFVIEDLAEERGQDAASRPDYVASPNDNVIIEGIAGSQVLARLGRLRLLRREHRHASRRSRSTTARAAASLRRPRRSPAASTRCHARCTST